MILLTTYFFQYTIFIFISKLNFSNLFFKKKPSMFKNSFVPQYNFFIANLKYDLYILNIYLL